MSPFLFWLFSALMLIFATMVILLRHPVSAALSLVVSFLALAALFVTLDAFFIGIIEVLVYAGAVMVLFLFIIMLLELKPGERRKISLPLTFGGLFVVGVFALMIHAVIESFTEGQASFPALAVSNRADVWQVGHVLFSDYNLPFQVIGVLILVATVGVVVLSRKELK